MAVKTLSIDEVRTDGGTQTRAELRPDVIQEYADAIRRGDAFPPVDVFLDKAGNYWLADGFHRFNGTATAEMESIKATVHKGELRDAIWFALSANATNGLRRTNEDKRRCVTLALSDMEWSSRTDQQLADHCGVSHVFVNRIRSELLTVKSSDPPKRKGKDGKARPAKYKPRAKQETRAADTADEFEPDESACTTAVADEPEPAVTRKPEPNTIGALKDRLADFLNDLITNQPAHVRVVLADYLEELAGEIRKN